MNNEQTLTRSAILDCASLSTREINQQLRALAAAGVERVQVLNPAGRHNLAVGLSTPIEIHFCGPVGYYCGGLGDGVQIEVAGGCGWSVGENLMAGQLVIRGNASANAAASAHGGKIYVLGDAGPRAGISLKGATLIVTGNVGYGSAFMMQQGRLIICGNAGAGLADSIYDGEIFVAGRVHSLGADAQFGLITDEDRLLLNQELLPLGLEARDYDFKKIVCAQEFHHFKTRNFPNGKTRTNNQRHLHTRDH